MKHFTLRSGLWAAPTAFVLNLFTVYVVYALCRIVFLCSNWGTYAAGWALLDTGRLLEGTLFFDTSAILYTNALYALRNLSGEEFF